MNTSSEIRSIETQRLNALDPSPKPYTKPTARSTLQIQALASEALTEPAAEVDKVSREHNYEASGARVLGFHIQGLLASL